MWANPCFLIRCHLKDGKKSKGKRDITDPSIFLEFNGVSPATPMAKTDLESICRSKDSTPKGETPVSILYVGPEVSDANNNCDWPLGPRKTDGG